MFTALACTSCRQLFRIAPAGFKRDQTGHLVRLCESCQVDHQSATTTATRITASDILDGQTQELIRGLKYRNQRRAVSILARQLVKSVRDDPDALAFEIVTWAPTSSSRRRGRGYDQSELLARAVARQLGIPCRRLLYRDHSRPQTGRTRQERLHGPLFRARPLRRAVSVLVIDDVVTTGSTLKAAAHALELAGAHQVGLFAVAATPERRRG
ncbi:MAG: ComF family protein [Ilumatobacteraceae bacterium]|nr:ComF family protein [Ilumatobacteraceae bacterium]